MKAIVEMCVRFLAGGGQRRALFPDDAAETFSFLEKRLVWNADVGDLEAPPPIIDMPAADPFEAPPPDLSAHLADQIVGDAMYWDSNHDGVVDGIWHDSNHDGTFSDQDERESWVTDNGVLIRTEWQDADNDGKVDTQTVMSDADGDHQWDSKTIWHDSNHDGKFGGASDEVSSRQDANSDGHWDSKTTYQDADGDGVMDDGERNRTESYTYDPATGQMTGKVLELFSQGHEGPSYRMTENYTYDGDNLTQITRTEDYTADGKPDNVVTERYDHDQLLSSETIDYKYNGDHVTITTTSDADGDGKPDHAVAEVHGPGDVALSRTVINYEYDGGKVTKTTTEDSDADGKPDKVVTENLSARGSILNSATVEYKYDGDNVVITTSQDNNGDSRPDSSVTEVRGPGDTLLSRTTVKYEWDSDHVEECRKTITEDSDGDGKIDKIVIEDVTEHGGRTTRAVYDPDHHLAEVQVFDSIGRNYTLTGLGADGRPRIVGDMDWDNDGRLDEIEPRSPEYTHAYVSALKYLFNGDPDHVNEHGERSWNRQDPEGRPVTITEDAGGNFRMDVRDGNMHRVFSVREGLMSMDAYKDDGEGNPDANHRVSGWTWDPASDTLTQSTYDENGRLAATNNISGWGTGPPETPPLGLTAPKAGIHTGAIFHGEPYNPSTERIDIGRGPSGGGLSLGDRHESDGHSGHPGDSVSQLGGRPPDAVQSDSLSARRIDSSGGADFLKLGASGMAMGGDASGGDGSGGDGVAGSPADAALNHEIEFVPLENAEMSQSGPEIFGHLALADAEDVAIEKEGAFTEGEMLAAASGSGAEGQPKIMLAQAGPTDSDAYLEGGGGAGADGADAAIDEFAGESLLSMKKLGVLAAGIGAVVGVEAAHRGKQTIPAAGAEQGAAGQTKDEENKD